jgi:hypothetical protein
VPHEVRARGWNQRGHAMACSHRWIRKSCDNDLLNRGFSSEVALRASGHGTPCPLFSPCYHGMRIRSIYCRTVPKPQSFIRRHGDALRRVASASG